MSNLTKKEKQLCNNIFIEKLSFRDSWLKILKAFFFIKKRETL